MISGHDEPLLFQILLNGDENGTTVLPWSTTQVSSNQSIIPICKQLLLQEIGNKSVRIWDVAILVPNLVFILFLMYTFRHARNKLRMSNSPNSTALYILVVGSTIVNVTRCIVSISITASNSPGGIIDKVLWLLLKFFLLAAELSVLTFALLFGHLDTRTSVKRVLVVTVIVSLLYSTVQTSLEFKYPDDHYRVDDAQYDLFSHGGMLFWMVTSGLLLLTYIIAFVLPLTRLQSRFQLPMSRRFYSYCGTMGMLYMLQVVGSGLIFADRDDGMCVVDVTCYLYFSFFSVLVYIAFLHTFLASSQSKFMFSYKPQQDEGEMPAGAFPRFPGIYSPDFDDYLYTPDSFLDSTDLDLTGNAANLNPMYNPNISSMSGGSLVFNDFAEPDPLPPVVARTEPGFTRRPYSEPRSLIA